MSAFSPDPRFASEEDLAACRASIRQGSRSFFAASLFLGGGLREPAYGLYAFCRLADDAVDLGGGDSRTLEDLRARLARIYDGCPAAEPADRAFADVVRRFAIPKGIPEALLDGMAWDAEGRRYRNLSELYAYAARVAGTVGAMMSLLMGARAPDVVARACDLGVAMQLTNIARDVGEDARAGRIYLPLDWLADAGIDPDAWLEQPVFSEPLGAVVRRLLQAADALYARAEAGIAQLPPSCRPAIYAARYLYAEIGCEVARLGFDSLSQRAIVSRRRKALLLGRSLAAAASHRPSGTAKALAEVRFLVEAVAAAAPLHPATALGGAPWWNLGARAEWVIGLCERLEQQDRAERSLLRRSAVP